MSSSRAFVRFLFLLVAPIFIISNVRSAQASNATPADSGWTMPIKHFDVLVIGGTPSGVAAALAAARNGAKVLLVEPRDALGGDIVFAMLNMFDMPSQPDAIAAASSGIFGEFYRSLGIAFDISKASALFESKTASQSNLTIWRRAEVSQVWKNGTTVSGALIAAVPGARNLEMPAQLVGVKAKVFIDASNNADFAARAGAKYFVGREAGGFDSKQQSVSLLFSVSGANWDAMKAYVRTVKPMEAAARIGRENASDVAPTTAKDIPRKVKQSTPHKLVDHTLGGVNGNYMWERGDVVEKYHPHDPNILAMSINFGRQSDGTVVLNTLNAVGVNGLDVADKERARQAMIAEIPPFIKYLRGAMPGLEKIRLVKIAPELYIRETRHVRGYYELTVDDIRAGRRFPDRVAFASYPLDLHPYEIGQDNPFGPDRYEYSIPLRSLTPRAIDGVFVASRCLSAEYEAAGSARVIPITMAMGQACGTAAALIVKNKWTPHQLVSNAVFYKQVQDKLREDGMSIGDKLKPQ